MGLRASVFNCSNKGLVKIRSLALYKESKIGPCEFPSDGVKNAPSEAKGKVSDDSNKENDSDRAWEVQSSVQDIIHKEKAKECRGEPTQSMKEKPATDLLSKVFKEWRKGCLYIGLIHFFSISVE